MNKQREKKTWGENEKFRAKRIEPLIEMIKHYHNQLGSVSIIDIGGTREYWNIVPLSLLKEHNVKITCVNLPGKNNDAVDDEIFTHICGNGCDLSFINDKQFNIAHSNSVVEHVGYWSNMVKYSTELKRVADSYFVQTPNFWFPIEPHRWLICAHWLPRPVEVWLLMHIKPLNNRVNGGKPRNSIDSAMRAMDSTRILSKKMFRYLFPEGCIVTERVWGLAKSFVVYTLTP